MTRFADQQRIKELEVKLAEKDEEISLLKEELENKNLLILELYNMQAIDRRDLFLYETEIETLNNERDEARKWAIKYYLYYTNYKNSKNTRSFEDWVKKLSQGEI